MRIQEENSVTYVQQKCIEAEYLSGAYIMVGSNKPCYDGEIILYSKENTDRVDGNEMFIPVQVKGKDVNVFSNKSSYPVKMKHMNNYKNNGGVLFLVVEIINQEKKLFARNLFPEDIEKILKGKENQKTVTIHLKEADSPKSFLRICKEFVEKKRCLEEEKQNQRIKKMQTYEERCECNDYGISKEFSYSEGEVYIHAFLPHGKQFHISVGIIFRKYSDDDFIITLGNKETILSLFKGIRTPLSLCKRGFVEYADKEYYCIKLNNMHITIKSSIVQELANGIDRLFDEYVLALKACEHYYNVEKLYYDKSYGFRIAKISEKYWEIIKDYTYMHDYQKSGEKDVFEPNEYMIKIYTQNHPVYGTDFHAILKLVKDEESIFRNNEYWLCWDFIEKSIYYKRDEFTEEGVWSVEYVQEWIKEKLIPDVNDFYLRKISKRKRNYIKEWLENQYSFRELQYIYTERHIDLVQFNNILRRLQGYYYSSLRDTCIERDEIQALFLIVYNLVAKCTMMNQYDLEYISKHLFEKSCNYSILLTKLSEESKKVTEKQGDINYYISFLFDAMIICITNYEIEIDSNEIKNFVDLLRPSIDQYNLYKLLEKAIEY